MDILLSLFGQTPKDDWTWKLDNTSGWSLANALSMANCALLAYNDPSTIHTHLDSRGFLKVIPIQSKSPAVDTQVFVGVRDDAVVVSFRGTEPSKPQDLLTDFMTARVEFSDRFSVPGWGYVWQGWADGVSAILPELLDCLKEHDSDQRSLWITGHSLGGALATVVAAILANLQDHPIRGVYTYGQPRVGDPAFCQRYTQALGDRTFRHVNDRDLVTHVPPRRFTRLEQHLFDPRNLLRISDLAGTIGHRNEVYEYQHIGQLRLLLPDGGWSSDPADEDSREPDFLKEERDDFLALLNLAKLSADFIGLLKDHAPINPLTHDGYIERIEGLSRA